MMHIPLNGLNKVYIDGRAFGN